MSVNPELMCDYAWMLIIEWTGEVLAHTAHWGSKGTPEEQESALRLNSAVGTLRLAGNWGVMNGPNFLGADLKQRIYDAQEDIVKTLQGVKGQEAVAALDAAT